MIRKIIRIDTEKCNGCGLCLTACHEGAIGMKDGKAVLLRDDYCDGLGDCLPACPTGAITFEVREALPYDEEAVLANMRKKENAASRCPGSMSRELQAGAGTAATEEQPSCLKQWPVQLRLVPGNAAFLQNADLLIAADCTAFAFGAFHQKFMNGRITLVGCPKLDPVDYAEKLAEILGANPIASITVVKMSVPCCQGLAAAVMRAIEKSGQKIVPDITTISSEGEILSTPEIGLHRMLA